MVKKYSFFNGTFFPLNLCLCLNPLNSVYFESILVLPTSLWVSKNKKTSKNTLADEGNSMENEKNTFEPSNMKFDFTAQHFQYTGWCTNWNRFKVLTKMTLSWENMFGCEYFALIPGKRRGNGTKTIFLAVSHDLRGPGHEHQLLDM